MNFIPKPTLLLSIAMGLIFSLFLFSCARTSNSQQNDTTPLVAALKVLNVSVKDTISVQMEFRLKNMTADTLEILKWGTPLEGELTDDMFDVQVDGKKVEYIGIQVKRGAPEKEDFIKLAPHGSVAATFFLEKGYDLKDPGQYSVQYSKPYVSVRIDSGEEQLMPVDSGKAAFTVPE